MAIDQDPYRTLGLARGASIDEIKRAYRRLAKIHHPDAAGEKNVPRFLAIQAAYEQLAGGLDGKATVRRPSAAPRKPWEADPDRSDATRRAYGGRGRGPASGTSGTSGPSRPSSSGAGSTSASGAKPGTGPSPRPGSTRSGRRGTGPTAGAGTTGSADSTGGAVTADSTGPGPGPTDTTPRSARERKRNKATLGSTSYDGVDGPFEPDWRGASWYGTTSGTYWTLNPKEYADPRKHGPEYQARARRATRSRTPDAPDTAASADSVASDEPPTADGPETTARPTHTTTSWWESTAGASGAAGAGGATPTSSGAAQARARTVPPDAPSAPPPPPDLGRAIGDIGRAITDPGFGGQRGRIIRALIGWLPIALGVSWLAGEMTGCGRFAATCDGSAEPFVLILEVVALVVLLLVPSVGSIAAMGAITLLAAAILAALILSATGEAADSGSRQTALGAVLLIAWLAGLGIAIVKRMRPPSSTTRPVS